METSSSLVVFTAGYRDKRTVCSLGLPLLDDGVLLSDASSFSCRLRDDFTLCTRSMIFLSHEP